MTAPRQTTSCDMTRSSAITSKLLTMISPPTNAYGQGDTLYVSSETAEKARIRVNPGLKERDRKDKTYQTDGVECDWQTVFWRLPTPPHRSDNQGVPSFTKATVSSRTLAGAARDSPSGLESHLAEDEAVTLGEQLAGEMIWGDNEDLRSSTLYFVTKEKPKAVTEGNHRSLIQGRQNGFDGVRAKL